MKTAFRRRRSQGSASSRKSNEVRRVEQRDVNSRGQRRESKEKLELKERIEVESPRGWAATGALHRPAPPAFHLSPGRIRARKGDVRGTRWGWGGDGSAPLVTGALNTRNSVKSGRGDMKME